MGSPVPATIASVIMKLLVLFCVASCLVISSEGTGRRRKNADEAVSDAEGVYGVGLGDSLSSLEKRSAQPSVGRKANEAVSEADAEGVHGVGLGDSLSSLEKRSAQPWGQPASNSFAAPRWNLWIGKRSAQPWGKRPRPGL